MIALLQLSETGELSQMQEDRIDLYKKDAKGKIRIWSIWSDGDYIMMEHGLLGGEIQENSEPVHFGLQNRTKAEQIAMRIKSRVNKKLDQGSCRTQQEALTGSTKNLLGYQRQMNAQSLKTVSATPQGGVYIQLKLNGHRCSIVNDNGTIKAYSKGGKPITSIPEILSELKIPKGKTLDGELYHHGTPLQTIGSWVKRRQENTLKLRFMCFDVMMDGNSKKRDKFLRKKVKFGEKSEYIETTYFKGYVDVIPLLKKALSDGFEGLILRKKEAVYEYGKRSHNILKVKRKITSGTKDSFMIDDEFLVVNIKASKDGWAVLMCETESGVKFNMSAPGTVPEKTEILKNKNDYIGKHIRAEFEGYTKSKKPVEAVALMFREKQDE